MSIEIAFTIRCNDCKIATIPKREELDQLEEQLKKDGWGIWVEYENKDGKVDVPVKKHFCPRCKLAKRRDL